MNKVLYVTGKNVGESAKLEGFSLATAPTFSVVGVVPIPSLVLRMHPWVMIWVLVERADDAGAPRFPNFVLVITALVPCRSEVGKAPQSLMHVGSLVCGHEEVISLLHNSLSPCLDV